MIRLAHLSLMVLTLGLASGCCHIPYSASAPPPEHLTAPLSQEFSYSKPKQFMCEETAVSTVRQYSVSKVELKIPAGLTSDATNRTLVLDYFVPRKNQKHPVLLILPMLGGSYPLEKYFAVYFAKRGFATIIVHREKLPKDATLAALNPMLRQSVIDNRLAIDWIESRPELDPDRIGVFGISMGAIKGAMLTPLDDRVRAATLGLVGGDLPYILVHTTEPGIAKRRKAILSEQHLTSSQLQEKLHQNLSYDPNALGRFVDPARVLLVLGEFDTVVPTRKGLEMREKWGGPETILVPTGHYTAVLFVPYIQRECYQFLRRKLAPRHSSEQAALQNRQATKPNP